MGWRLHFAEEESKDPERAEQDPASPRAQPETEEASCAVWNLLCVLNMVRGSLAPLRKSPSLNSVAVGA